MTTLRLTAPLAADARYFSDTRDGAWLALRLQVGHSTARLELRMGAGFAAQHVAAAAARRYRKGEVVTAYAESFTFDRADGELILHGVDRVELIPTGLDRLSPDTLTLQEATA